MPRGSCLSSTEFSFRSELVTDEQSFQHYSISIQRAAAETKTKGGLLIPEKAQAKTNEALVVAVGPGAKTEDGQTVPMSVAVGDKVLLPEFGGNKIEVDGEEFAMYRETDIVAKLTE